MKHARVIVPRRLEGKTYREIAKELALTEYGVANRAAVTWKPGPLDATFINQQRGRDSNFRESRGKNRGLTKGWHRIRHSFDQHRF